MSDSQRGEFVWKSPDAKPVPQFGIYLGALALFVLAGFIGFAMYEFLLPMRGAWSMPVTWICLAATLGAAAWSAYVVYCALNYVPTLGIQFFQRGIEFGEGKKRVFVPYAELESINFTVVPAPDGTDQAFKVARAAISVVAMNPAGIGRSLREFTEETIYSELSIKPPRAAVLTFPLTRPVHDTLARLLARK